VTSIKWHCRNCHGFSAARRTTIRTVILSGQHGERMSPPSKDSKSGEMPNRNQMEKNSAFEDAIL
jgi:hypothetical protein